MALAFYRTYRPRRFSDVVGQADVTEALKRQVAAGRVSHAYIFTGIRGTGKTTLAKILAKAVNCGHTVEGEPCGVCDICTGIDDGSVLDVTEIDAASNNGVDNIRELREETAYIPVSADRRVYIVDEVHMLSINAFNALLKIMEEPPPHVMFILATTEINRVPATILSRCQRFDLKRIAVSEIAKRLLYVADREQVSLTVDGALAIARLADGAMRDALSLLDTAASVGGTVDAAAVNRFSGAMGHGFRFKMTEDIAGGDLPGLMRDAGESYGGSVSPETVCRELMEHFRNLLMAKIGGEALLASESAEDIAEYLSQSECFTPERILGVLDELKKLAELLPRSVNKRLLLELSLISLCRGDAPAATVPERGAVRRTAADGATRNTPKEEAEAGPKATVSRRMKPASGSVLFDEWPRVVEAMKLKHGMIYGFMQDSVAYRSPTHLLIECSDLFKEKLRENREYVDVIKEVVAAETGLRLPIGPYSGETVGKDDAKMAPAVAELIRRAEAAGVPVEIR